MSRRKNTKMLHFEETQIRMHTRNLLGIALLLGLTFSVTPPKTSQAQNTESTPPATQADAPSEGSSATTGSELAAPPSVDVTPTAPEANPFADEKNITESLEHQDNTTTPTPNSVEPEANASLRLSLADAIAMGIQNNLHLEVERHDPLMAAEEWQASKGAYDPEFFIDGGYADLDRPTASSLDGTSDPSSAVIQIKQWDGQGGLRGVVPWLGAEYKLAYDAARTETNSRVAQLSPQYRTGLHGELKIPLLRNLIWNKPWTTVHAARAAYQAENEKFRGALMDTVLEIEKAYWNLIATAEKKRVAEKSLETARALLHQSEIQYEVGVISRVEVTEAKAGVAEREVNLIRAENTYRSAQDQLLHLTMAQELRASPVLAIEATDELGQYTPYTIDLEVALQKANENRPQLAASEYDMRRLEFVLKHAKNQRLPQLDVYGRYGYEGLAGSANPDALSPPVAGLPDNYSDSHDDFFHRDGSRQWATRGTFSIPLGNRTASHQVNKTEFELRKAQTQHRYLEQKIVLEVRDAVRNLQSALEGIEAAERRRVAAEEQLRAEKLRLENGESTPFDVLQRERDLVAAESEKIAALQLYRNSDASLDYAQGTILKNRDIRLEDAGSLH